MALSSLHAGAAGKDAQAEAPFDWTEREAAPEPEACAPSCDGCKPLYDGASFVPNPKQAPLNAVEQAQVRKAYTRYLASDHCQSDETHLDPSEIGSPEDMGSVGDVIAGSFTAAGRRQKLVLFEAGHCGKAGFHSENYGKRLVILLEGERTLRVMMDAGTSLLQAIDVDGDGRHEVVALGAWSGSGDSHAWLDLFSFAGGARQALAHFDDLDSDPCAWEPDAQQHESRLSYRYDHVTQSLCFERREQVSACPLS